LQKTVKAVPKSADAYYFLGIAQRALGFSEMARASFAHALELRPRMTDAAVALANLEVKGGDQAHAIRLAETAIKANPDSAPAYVVSARALLAKGDLRQAEALLQDALQRDPSSLPALAALLKLYISLGKTEDAMKRIAVLVQQYPNNAGLHFLLAVGYLGLKDLDNSEISIRRAIALDPRTTDAYTLLANIDFAKGAIEQAKRDLRTAMDLHPNNAANFVALGTQYEKENNWDEAKRLFERAHQIDRSSPLIASELAYLYLDHGGDVNVAVTLAQTAKRNMPNSPATADALGWAYYKLGSTELAIAQLEESVQRYPRSPMYGYHLGMAYAAARRFGPARKSLLSALKEDPNSTYASSIIAELQEISASH
jgi:tetratricopeptide (TPR) repeat protein